jgi:cytidine deaminase
MDEKIQYMLDTAVLALKNSYSPYSQFAVASCIYSEDDNYFTGVNVENAAFGLTICAESAAITAMVSAGFTSIKSMVILASNNALCTPCGACRQRILEFSTPDTRIYLCNKTHILQTCSIQDLLPMAFTLKP